MSKKGGSIWSWLNDHMDLSRAHGRWSEAIDEEKAKLGHVNIIVAGKTGVGKSTLINAMFGETRAAVGSGAPLTRGITWYGREGAAFALGDTRGLELAAFEETYEAISAEVTRMRRQTAVSDQLHAAWLCISEASSRVEPGEERIAKLLVDNCVPLIVVLTKAGSAKDFVSQARRQLGQARGIVRVDSIGTEFRGQAHSAFGLEELNILTRSVLPDGVTAAYDAAQRIDLKARVRNAKRALYAAMTAAGLAGAAPIPFVGSAALLPVLAHMIVAVSLRMGVPVTSSSLKPLAVVLVGSLAATAGGRQIAASLVEFIPGVGQLVGGAINSALALGTCYGLGACYIEFLRRFYLREGHMPSASEVLSDFPSFWKKWERKEDRPPSIGSAE